MEQNQKQSQPEASQKAVPLPQGSVEAAQQLEKSSKSGEDINAALEAAEAADAAEHERLEAERIAKEKAAMRAAERAEIRSRCACCC
jgi:hypothetical protein